MTYDRHGVDNGKPDISFAKVYCLECSEPEKIKGIRVLQVDRGPTFWRSERYFFKPIGYCEHNKTAWFPFGVQESGLEKACKAVTEVMKGLEIKVPIDKACYIVDAGELSRHHEKFVKSEELREWKRKKGIKDKPEKRFLSSKVQEEIGIRLSFDEDDDADPLKYR